MSRRKLWTGIGLTGIALLGCEPAATPPTNDPVNTAPVATAPQTAAPEAAPSAVAQPAPDPEQPVLAKPGVGKRGQSLRNETGVGAMIATPAVTLFAVEQRAVFDIQIPKSMQLWEASNGRKPKSHDEFMSQIIKANSIQLPELPAGKVYRYHPEDAQLYVHPANE